MSQGERTTHDYSARRIIGFGCNQAFAFFLLYMQASHLFDVGVSASVLFTRPELLAFLASMAIGFAVILRLAPAGRQRLFSRPLLYAYALIMGIASLIPAIFPQLDTTLGLSLSCVLAGFPCAILLTAWGQTFGQAPTGTAIAEVLLGSLAAALICLAFSAAAAYSYAAWIALCLLPLASVVNIDVPADPALQKRSPSRTATAKEAAPSSESDEISNLSAKILVGTLLFGIAAGLLDVCWVLPSATQAAAETGDPVAADVLLGRFMLALVFFGSFLIGALTLQTSSTFARGTALNKSYRLAVFLEIIGIMMMPWPTLLDGLFVGEALALAGYLGLEAVLISLFLVIASLSGTRTSTAFSQGFLSLFSGEAIGLLAGNAILAGGDAAIALFLLVFLAGVIVLLSYVFLFTERDFDKLSQMENASDSLERTCAAIVAQFGLSAREADVLAFCLRGRTGERIAQELYISKSTVETHLKRIYGKTGVHNRQELLDLGESVGKSLQ